MRSRAWEDKMIRWAMGIGAWSVVCVMGCSSEPDVPATCEAYCDASLTTCVEGNAQFTNRAECLEKCPSFSTQGEDGDKKGNTLQCRMYHLSVASTDPMLHCPHSGVSGAGICVDDNPSQCDRYCGISDELCGTAAPQYASIPACLMECEANFRQAMEPMGNTVQCRIDQLNDASGAKTLGDRCKEGGKVGDSTVCVDAMPVQ